MKEMFRKLGFAPFIEEKEVAGDGAEKIILNSHKEGDPDVTVFMYNEVNEELGTKMYIQLNKKRYPEFKTQHPVVETAKDFPTLDFFKGADNDALQAFEDKLGFRQFNGDQSSDDNRSYDTTPEQIAKTNLEWVFYVRKFSSQGDLQYINCQVFAIPNEYEIRSEAVKNWLATNGFTDYNGYVPEHMGVEAFNANGDQCFLYAQPTDYDGTFCWMQIIDASHAVKTVVARKAFRELVSQDIRKILNQRMLTKQKGLYQTFQSVLETQR